MSDAIYIEITATKGSAPRDAGTVMRVTAQDTKGTIGGGALEYQAIHIARDMLAKDAQDRRRTFALGPGLGQCCGGSVALLFTRHPRPMDGDRFIAVSAHDSQPPRPLWVWGAGHVGRAVIEACPPRAFTVTWIDDAADRFPPRALRNVTQVPAADMPLFAARAPRDAHHLIFTYSHDIDFALCAALLKKGAASIGLIGSQTKRSRFFKRLSDLGLEPSAITCPIGDTSLGKHPRAIARGAINALLTPSKSKATA